MITDAASCKALLDFWFGPEAQPKWFVKDAAFDAVLRERFLGVYERAAAGALDDWGGSANAALALVLALDQLPRNLFRNDPRAFATDDKAVAVAEAAIERGFDLAVLAQRRFFFYLPLEHAEDLARQRRCVELMRERAHDPDLAVWAEKHLVIIERFGRFPHRNAALGRVSTPEETAFLQQPGSSF